MSFRQIFDRIVRIARSEMHTSSSTAFERELRRAEKLIEESRGESRTSVISSENRSSDNAKSPEFLSACKVLGVEPTATRVEISVAYRAHARRLHPDRVSHLTEEQQRVALIRMQELNLAYEYLDRNVG